MKNFYDPDFRVGILGGGQLGRMLIQSMMNLDVKSVVLDKGITTPAANFATDFISGDFDNYDDVKKLVDLSDVITIEIEHVNVEALQEAEYSGKKVFPQPKIIKLVQDKGVQKQFFSDKGFPTAPFSYFNKSTDLDRLNLENKRYILKKRRMGYDGRGVMELTAETPKAKIFSDPCILEEFINFDRELSVIVGRNEKGQMAVFPPIEMVFNEKNKIVEYLFAPAQVERNVSDTAIELAKELSSSLKIVGLLAVEMFLDKEGKLFINEIAPRPHNSGHHTIEANDISQFDLHLRAILNLPLFSQLISRPAVMVNILGSDGYYGKPKYSGLEKLLEVEGIIPHIYGKRETRPFRKMGHVTIVDDLLPEALKKANFVKKHLKVIS